MWFYNNLDGWHFYFLKEVFTCTPCTYKIWYHQDTCTNLFKKIKLSGLQIYQTILFCHLFKLSYNSIKNKNVSCPNFIFCMYRGYMYGQITFSDNCMIYLETWHFYLFKWWYINIFNFCAWHTSKKCKNVSWHFHDQIENSNLQIKRPSLKTKLRTLLNINVSSVNY
jgi:hypothetical protein